MTGFEQDLRDALGRQDPPEGFAERVVAAAGAAGPGGDPRPWSGWVAAAAAAAILISGLFMDSARVQRVRLERARGEEAKQELLVALKVTGTVLGEIEARVRQAQPVRIVAPGNN